MQCSLLLEQLKDCRESTADKPALDKALARTFKKRKRMVDAGFAIGPRAWKRAKHGDEVQETRGRPSKAQSRDLIQKVVDLVSNNTQSSSIWLAKLGREARVLTASLHAMYWKSDLVADVKLTLFYQLVNEHCPWAIEARKETDVCDHCWLLRSTIQPGLVRLIKHARSALGTALPGYFAGFNMERLLAPENVPVSEDLLDEFATFINKHAERHQAERGVLKGRARVDLHSLEAKVEHALRWEKQVYSSYLWHVNCYERQNAAIAHLTEHLPPHGLLIWMDWKQNLSLPISGTETSDQFYGTERHECSVHGIVVLQNVGGEIQRTEVVQLSPVIEHTALASACLLEKVKSYVPNWEKSSIVHVFSDCGPHYRCLELVAYWVGSWFANLRCHLQINLLCEKHGKGAVDQLFSKVNSWIASYVKDRKARIETVDQLHKVFSAAAAKDNSTTKNKRYMVDLWSPDSKPESSWRMATYEFHIKKTYCLQMRQLTRNRLKPVFLDFVLSDRTSHARGVSRHMGTAEEVELEPGVWRRGYFGSQRWKREVPKRGASDTIMKRMKFHESAGLDVSARNTKESPSEKAMRRTARKLLCARKRYSERLTTKLKETSESSSSASSSSTTSSDSD
ncbi:unnamed protein product [Effrenium voratum]|uniref:Uncharacterized protein n=1 Tax=Effrenium voratum TaxID=2562239 RepID=A0AA36ICF4_9DINO|nr:unnamed protein product [Effrenium voratum]